jgi:hypothetical protein
MREMKNTREKIKKLEQQLSLEIKYNKCYYVNELFPFNKNTCSVKPAFNFKNIYINDPLIELWEFQQLNCLDNHSRIGEKLLLILMTLIIIDWHFTSRQFRLNR